LSNDIKIGYPFPIAPFASKNRHAGGDGKAERILFGFVNSTNRTVTVRRFGLQDSSAVGEKSRIIVLTEQ